ncbi:putative quinol monooxygenase [Halobacillus halophilus]|uniref:putative quinol monooxygenase n=1 Tax=Halobacillus halophilus TaxID=1570 RepID=UPI001CD61324|nr:putative quinol monooxygenase [Halobacillus halophilus]MCA1012652.1 antibiotic biosynthesis monooxygenase [Halobacillus halophilus]
MAKLAVTAIFKPKDGYKDRLLDELEKVKEASREEEGCIQYDLHQSIESTTIFLYEVWKDSDAVQSHIETAHYKTYRENTEDLLDSREVNKWNFI